MIDIFSIPFIGSVFGGIIGNRSDDRWCEWIRQIEDKFRKEPPVNHHVHRAVRRAMLLAVRIEVRRQFKTLWNPSVSNTPEVQAEVKAIRELDKWLSKEIAETHNDEYKPAASAADNRFNHLLQSDIAGNARTEQLKKQLQEEMLKELRNNALDVTVAIETYIKNNNSDGWYNAVCGLFEHEIRRDKNLSNLLSNKLLAGLMGQLEGEDETLLAPQFQAKLHDWGKPILKELEAVQSKLGEMDESLQTLIATNQAAFDFLIPMTMNLPDIAESQERLSQFVTSAIQELHQDMQELHQDIQAGQQVTHDYFVAIVSMLQQILTQNSQLTIETAIQSRFQALVSQVQSFIAQLSERFTGTTDNRPPLQIHWVLDEEHRRRARFLTKSRWVPLIGRETEMNELRAFLQPVVEDNRKFKWMLWTGSGGQGKTRLALELVMDALGQGWDAGFYERMVQYGDWRNWKPEKNTLIVFDYAALQPEAVRGAILSLANKAQGCPYQLRVLVLERAYDDQSEWVKTIRCQGNDRDTVEQSYFSRGTIQPRTVTPLNEEQFLDIMVAYYEQCPGRDSAAQMPDREQFRDALRNLPAGDYRPLFAAFAGEAAAVQGLNAVRQWNSTQLVDWILDRESERWTEAGVDALHANLLALATLTGGMKEARAWYLAEQHDLLPKSSSIISSQLRALDAYTPHSDSQLYHGLEPDILGELYILERLNGKYQIGPGVGDDGVKGQTTRLMQIAWEIEPLGMAQFLIRCATDFPSHPALRELLMSKPPAGSGGTGGNLAQLLYPLALADAASHLLPQEAQSLFEDIIKSLSPEQRAKALYNRGVRYAQAGETEKEIQDYTAVIEMPDVSAEQRAQALYNRGVVYAQAGDLAAAEVDGRIALCLFLRLFGLEHPYTQSAVGFLSQVLGAMGKSGAEVQAQVMEIRRRALATSEPCS